MGYLSKGDRITNTEQDLIDIIGVLGTAGQILRVNGSGTSIEWASGSGTGTVTSVSIVTANGVSGSVTTATTTPAITLILGVITPTSVNGLTFVAAAVGFTIAGGTTSKILTVSNTITLSGTDSSTLNIGAGGTLGTAAFTAATAYAAALSGTINEIAYFNSATTIASLAVATYPSLTELSYVKGVTSAIQTQLGAKAPTTAPTFATSITGSYLTASEILITDGSKNIVSAPVATYPSLTELTYLKGVTSAIQTQLNAKGIGDMVLASVQSVTGLKTFDTTKLAVKGSSTGSTAVASANAGATDYTQTLQAKTGTIANSDDAFYIGTTQVALNRASAALTLAGITLTTPDIGTPSAGVLTNATGLPIAGLVASTSTAIGVGSIELGHATDTTIARVSAGVISVEGVTVDTATNTLTLTNKRITPRILSAASYTTDTGTSLNCDNLDEFIVTAQAGALKLNNPTGTPTDGQVLFVAVTGTAARALTYDTQFEASTITLPTTTVTTARLNMLFIWRADTSKWTILAAV